MCDGGENVPYSEDGPFSSRPQSSTVASKVDVQAQFCPQTEAGHHLFSKGTINSCDLPKRKVMVVVIFFKFI